MAADGLHGKIEQVVRKTGKVEDFNDFVDCCQKASKRMKVVKMECSDFMKLENKFKAFNRKIASDEIMPYFKDIVSVKFLKGSTNFLYKTDYEDPEYKVCSDVLRKKARLEFPPKTLVPRGISTVKKSTIIKDLVPKMQASRKPFWLELPENESAADLLEEGL